MRKKTKYRVHRKRRSPSRTVFGLIYRGKAKLAGWIRLCRYLFDDELLTRCVSHLTAWIFILVHAAYQEQEVWVGSRKVTLGVGECIISYREMAKYCFCTHVAVRKALKAFEAAGRIRIEPTHRYTKITILRWDENQDALDKYRELAETAKAKIPSAFRPEEVRPAAASVDQAPVPVEVVETQTEEAAYPVEVVDAYYEEAAIDGDTAEPEVTITGLQEDYPEVYTDHKADVGESLFAESVEAVKPAPQEKDYKGDLQTALEAWNRLEAHGLTKIRSISKAREKLLTARLKEYGIEGFMECLENIKKSSFLRGQSSRGWIINFDWLIKPNNFIKVLEGNYTDRTPQGPVAGNQNGFYMDRFGVDTSPDRIIPLHKNDAVAGLNGAIAILKAQGYISKDAKPKKTGLFDEVTQERSVWFP